MPLAGKPLILHTVERAKAARNISRVIVATDSEEILNIIKESGNEAVLTSENHQSGSDRIAEVAANLPENSIIVNVQGDEPLIHASTIERAVEAIFESDEIQMTTTCEPIEEAQDVLSPDVVKVVTDENGFALYFSRSPIPFARDAVKKHGSLENALRNEPELISLYRKHTGLYVYRREFLLRYTKLKQTFLEKTEMLEQLRALENGAKIKVVEVAESSIGVDTPEDFERVREIIEQPAKINYRSATIQDVPQVAKVHVESWQKSFQGIVPQKFLDNMSIEKREKAFRESFHDESYQMLVAENLNGEIIGFADFGKSRHKNLDFESELYAIYLLPQFQGKGIGRNLFQKCVKILKTKNSKSMCLQALSVSPYRNFYKNLGGKIVSKSKHKLADEEFETILYGWNDLTKI